MTWFINNWSCLVAADRQPSYCWSHGEILVRPIVRIKKQPIRNPVIWHSLANQKLSYKKYSHVLAQRKIVLVQRKTACARNKLFNTVDQSQGFAVYRWVLALFADLLWLLHQGDEAFSEHSRGRQCAFMSLAALLFNPSNSVDLWT